MSNRIAKYPIFIFILTIFVFHTKYHTTSLDTVLILIFFHSILIYTKMSNIKALDLLLVTHLLSNRQFGCLQVEVNGLKGYKDQKCLS